MKRTKKDEWRELESCKKLEFYTLVDLLLQDGKIKRGWWTGHVWDGLHLKKTDEVIKWKPSKEENEWLKNKYYH